MLTPILLVFVLVSIVFAIKKHKTTYDSIYENALQFPTEEKKAYPIEPLNWNPVNRNQRRKTYFELDRNAFHFNDIEDRFILEVFNSQEPYEIIYNQFNREWKELINEMKSRNSFRYTRANESYFTDMYAPVANECQTIQNN